MSHNSLHITPRAVPYCQLSVGEAFKGLTSRQRLYAHYFLRASWWGTYIGAAQLSRDAAPVLRFYYQVLSKQPVPQLKQAAQGKGLSEDDVDQFLEFFAMLYTNMGNYTSFGDKKFIPSCTKEAFSGIAQAAGVELDAGLLERVFDLSEGQLALGFPPSGVSAYYSPNMKAADAELANRFLVSKRMSCINTTVCMEEDGTLRIWVASVEERELPAEEFEGRKVHLCYGAFKEQLQHVVEDLREARKYAENETQERMIDHYIEHFLTGNVEAHKASQREWVKDVGPIVETNIGFIESYRDPSGVRAEWEGFVAVVNKQQSKRYAALVEEAPKFITQLPWKKDFEKDAFSSPDFTSLDVVGFASSGIPLGICIPNYEDIRQEVGFKNVYLSNCGSAINLNDKPTHLSEADWEEYKQWIVLALSVNVGIHELLGHGTGKLLMEREDGSLNFEKGLIDPISKAPVTSWYKPGEGYSTVFGGVSNAMEECRAEAVALFLSVDFSLLDIFDLKDDKSKEQTMYICWLSMIRAGLVGLEFYSPETKRWGQAHMRARFCILQSLLRAENSIVTIKADEKEGLLIELDRARIKTDGVKAIGDLLLNLNVNKSTANAERGVKYFSDLTEVDQVFEGYRDIVLAKRKPRREFVQAHSTLNEDGLDAILEEFDGSVEGVVKSFLARHKSIPL